MRMQLVIVVRTIVRFVLQPNTLPQCHNTGQFQRSVFITSCSILVGVHECLFKAIATKIFLPLFNGVSVLMDVHISFPMSNAWNEVVNGFEEKWGYPQCAGAIDGSHTYFSSCIKSY